MKEEVVVEFTVMSYNIPGRTEENKEYCQSSQSVSWSQYDPKTYEIRRRTTKNSTATFGAELSVFFKK